MFKSRLFFASLAALLLVVALISALSVACPAAAQEGNDGCTWNCLEHTWDRDTLLCSGAAYNCTACELRCPEILNRQ